MTHDDAVKCSDCGALFGEMNPHTERLGRYVCEDREGCIDRAADHRIAVFLQGGRFSGDRGAIVAPAPDLLYAVPCDCSPLTIEPPCGQASHWHDVEKGDELADMPRHGAYYVKVRQHPARSGMEAALYWHAGPDRPTARDMHQFRNMPVNAV